MSGDLSNLVLEDTFSFSDCSYFSMEYQAKSSVMSKKEKTVLKRQMMWYNLLKKSGL